MSEETNDALDARVIAAIVEGNKKFDDICKKLGAVFTPDLKHVRPIDRALQRLRMKGKIIFNKRDGWSIV